MTWLMPGPLRDRGLSFFRITKGPSLGDGHSAVASLSQAPTLGVDQRAAAVLLFLVDSLPRPLRGTHDDKVVPGAACT